MNLQIAFYKAATGTGYCLKHAFSFVSGGMMLKKRGIRRDALDGVGPAGVGIAFSTFMIAGMITNPVTLMGFAILTALSLEAGFLPAQLHALFVSGRHDLKDQKTITKPKKEFQQV